MLGGGIAGVLGSFMPWGTITAPIIGATTVSGVDGPDGWITAAVGLAIAGVRLSGRSLPAFATTAAAVGGVALAALGIWDVVDLYGKVDNLKDSLSSTDDPFGLTSSLMAAVHVSVGAGLWLLIAAGVAAATGAILTLLSARRA